ncbi:MAG TPA: hypothetical protein VMW22_08125 [Candidatus Desulfaltia sp.]|nr:hypothetical protein [Candidatus Desulfaltia sp.]
MVSWSDAFGKAIKTVLMSLGFIILGVVIIVIGIAAGTSSGYYYTDYNYMVIIPTFIMGILMIYLGGLASIFKIIGDMLEEEKSRTYYIKQKEG